MAAFASYAGDCKALVRLADESWSGAILAGGPGLPEECMDALIGIRRKGVKILGLHDFYEHAIPSYSMGHMLKPGVTGWAQVMYPYGASVDDAREKLQYDLYYLRNYSLILYMAILMKTVRVVLVGRGR